MGSWSLAARRTNSLRSAAADTTASTGFWSHSGTLPAESTAAGNGHAVDAARPKATTSLPDAAKHRIAFIDIGRTLAALIVFYTHVANQFVGARHGQNPVTDAVTAISGPPLGLSEEGIGQIAICFFFLASGFVVTPIALRLGSTRFSLNRLFRLYPMIVFAVLFSAALLLMGLRPLTSGDDPEVTVGEVLQNVTLVNFFMKPFSAMVGVAWTLAVEVLFYLLLIAMLPLLRRWIWVAILVELELVLIVVLLSNQFGDAYGGFASQAAYVLLPIMGQILWAGWHGKVPAWAAGIALTAAWGLFVMAANLRMDIDYILRPTPIAYALLLFLVGLGVGSRMRQRRFWIEMSERAYSLYLMHGLVALPAMHALTDHLPLWLTLLIGIVATFVIVELTYKLVERPSHALGRRLSGRPMHRPATGRHARPA